MEKYELLAPAGDFSMLAAAVNAGADAVYFGLKEFSMRAKAGNFMIEDLDEIEKMSKSKNVKRYLTLNTIIYNSELKKIEKIIQKVKGKVDAIICWDFAVISLCRKYQIPFFVSTQASVSNIESAKFFKQIGAKRIILARELNLKQIKEISKIIDIETFCHGAMCVAVSGRCFTSQFLFNKSANRGECLHPCRRSYTVKDDEGNELKVENSRIFSAKDLCTLPFIEKMKKAGIKSFKIEGRNRDARYVDAVVRVYRKALDKKLSKKEIAEGMEELKKIYNKGYSSGFYLKTPTADDFAKTENNASAEKKHFVGKVTHYFDNVGVAAVKLVSGLNIGDKIVIIGDTTGIVKSEIDSIEINRKSEVKGKKGQEIGIKLPKVRKNDEVYLIKKDK
ncbi:MAG: U32 family peptidase [Candidatus Nanoarchaeia archaeon]|nr:U32 family peptidase [Candidatus Nanoarchaeia archaeon]MDD5357791.1 U32 family peptidase [Candidatus Nanoarchaeia archaeon]MDD5588710.1 U32 family peptidase [Candidatus Nanoarchaeia archaeon]